MFCKTCGASLPEGAKFLSAGGTAKITDGTLKKTTHRKIWNLLLSVCYLAVWAWFLHENSGKKALLVYKVWWSASLTGAVLCVCLLHLHFPELLLFAALPLSAFFLTQLFGLSYLFRPYVDLIYPIHAVICAVMLWLGIRKMKKLHP